MGLSVREHAKPPEHLKVLGVSVEIGVPSIRSISRIE